VNPFPMFIMGIALMLFGHLGQTRPVLAIVAIITLFALPAIWRFAWAIVRDAVLAFVIGFFDGEGVKLSGLFSRPKQIRKSPPLDSPAPPARRGASRAPSPSNLDPLDWRLRK
jgi:hypothetical protein